MNSDKENKPHKKQIKKENEIKNKIEKQQFKKDQFKFKEINKTLEEHVKKLDEINQSMDFINENKFGVYDRIYESKDYLKFKEVKNELVKLKENTEEIKNINEGNIVRKKQNIFSKTKNFLKNNRKTIDNYFITPALTIASIPLGMLYANREKSPSEKFFKVAKGMYISAIIAGAAIWMNYSEPETTIYENDNIEIVYENSYSSANRNYEPKALDFVEAIATIASSNYYFFESFRKPTRYNITKMNIHSKENKSSISATYEFDGFKTIEELNLEELNNPKELNVNGYNVDEFYANRKEYINEVKEIYENNKPKISNNETTEN